MRYFGISRVPDDLPRLSEFEAIVNAQALIPQVGADGNLIEVSQPEPDGEQLSMGQFSLLVLTGVSGPADLLAADESERPTFVAADLSGLFRPAAEAAVPLKVEDAGGWRVDRDGDTVTLAGAGDPVVALRLLCAATWSGVPLSGITAASDAARELLGAWKL
jgi:hypothetical protein